MKLLRKIILTGILMATVVCVMHVTSKAATVKVTGDTLNIRKEPSTNSSVIAMISKGVECELLKEQGDWYQIKYKNYTGYISKQYASLVEEPNTKPEEKPNTNETNDNSSDNKPNDGSNSDNSNTNNNTEQEPKEDNQTQNNIVYKKFTKNADVKILPLIYSSKIGEMKKGNQVILLTQTTTWSYIQADTISGWVRNDCLTEGDATSSNSAGSTSGNNTETNSTTSKEKTAYINEEYVNLRKGAGTNSSIVKVLTLNTQITIIGEEGTWYKVKAGNDTGYVSKEFVSNSKKVTSRSNQTRTQEINQVEEKNEQPKEEQKQTSQQSTTVKNESNTTTKGTDIIAYAKQYMGHKYVYGGDGSKGTFDCSGFTMYVYKHFGITLPHGATSQYKSGKGSKITKQSDLKTGDIVFLTDYSTGKGIGHCGIYIGNGDFIHASTTTYTVTISSLNTMYAGRFYAGLRLI